MIDFDGLERISELINDFAEGNPKSTEIVVAEGVYFSFDCPFEEDLAESVIPIAIGIESWSPLNEGEPTREVV